jgi:hypothetical protein
VFSVFSGPFGTGLPGEDPFSVFHSLESNQEPSQSGLPYSPLLDPNATPEAKRAAQDRIFRIQGIPEERWEATRAAIALDCAAMDAESSDSTNGVPASVDSKELIGPKERITNHEEPITKSDEPITINQ